MDTKDRQIGLANIARDRGLISAVLAQQIAVCKVSYEIIETLFTLIETNRNDETITIFLSRMVRNSK